jgi:hypothetical protein
VTFWPTFGVFSPKHLVTLTAPYFGACIFGLLRNTRVMKGFNNRVSATSLLWFQSRKKSLGGKLCNLLPGRPGIDVMISFSTIFGEKNGVFSKTNVMITIFAKN